MTEIQIDWFGQNLEISISRTIDWQGRFQSDVHSTFMLKTRPSIEYCITLIAFLQLFYVSLLKFICDLNKRKMYFNITIDIFLTIFALICGWLSWSMAISSTASVAWYTYGRFSVGLWQFCDNNNGYCYVIACK